MKTAPALLLIASMALATSAGAALTTFSYTQTDGATGAGTIDAFSYDDGGGSINFTATAMPAALVHNPAPGNTPAGFIGAQTIQTGNSNEANVAVGLLWSGFVTATGTRGTETFQIDIPLRYVPKQIQAPDTNDYNWSVAYGDNPAAGNDVSGTGFRFAMYFSRDDFADNAETPDTFQRYTQLTHTFAAGLDALVNTDTTTAPLKDATDAGAPAGVDAAGRDLAVYWAWRNGGTLPGGTAMLTDTFAFGGLLDADPGTLRLIPEPSPVLLALGAAGLFLRRRRRQ